MLRNSFLYIHLNVEVYLVRVRLPLQQDLGFAHAPLLPVLPGDPVVLLRAGQHRGPAIAGTGQQRTARE